MSVFYSFFAASPQRELRELYLFTILYSFANSLILIFEPVFFFKEGWSLTLIALFYALHYTLYLFLLPLGGKFSARFGTERSLAVAMPLFVVYFLSLAIMPHYPSLFWVAWVLLTLFKIFYWPAYHTEVARFSDGSNRGTELSWLYLANYGFGVLGPLAGGIIVVTFGFPTLFLCAAALAFLATFPLLRTKEPVRRIRFTYRAPWKLLSRRQHRRMRRAMYGWGENLIELVFWPIFMFMILGRADTLGYVSALSIFLMALFGFFIGEVSDRLPRRVVMRLHIPFMALGYLLRPVASSLAAIMFTDMLAKASFVGVSLPMWYILYSQGKRVGALTYIVAIEMMVAVTKAMTAWIIVGVFLVVAPYTGFVFVFTFAAFLSLLYFVL